VFGQSSGGTSIFALLASPLVEGLFQKAWLSSASPILNKTTTEAAKDNLLFLHNTACSDVDCLYHLTSEHVINAVPWDVYPAWAMTDQLDITTQGQFYGAMAAVDGEYNRHHAQHRHAQIDNPTPHTPQPPPPTHTYTQLPRPHTLSLQATTERRNVIWSDGSSRWKRKHTHAHSPLPQTHAHTQHTHTHTRTTHAHAHTRHTHARTRSHTCTRTHTHTTHPHCIQPLSHVFQVLSLKRRHLTTGPTDTGSMSRYL
jgi:hypothetical protein